MGPKAGPVLCQGLLDLQAEQSRMDADADGFGFFSPVHNVSSTTEGVKNCYDVPDSKPAKQEGVPARKSYFFSRERLQSS